MFGAHYLITTYIYIYIYIYIFKIKVNNFGDDAMLFLLKDFFGV